MHFYLKFSTPTLFTLRLTFVNLLLVHTVLFIEHGFCPSQWLSFITTSIILRLKKKSYVSKLPCAFVFQCVFDSAKFKVWIFFCLLNFFSSFLWTCLSKYTRKNMTDTMKHFEQQTSSICVLSCILFIHKSSSIFQSCERHKSDTSAAHEKKQTNKPVKKPHLGQVFQSVTSFET